MLQQSTLWRFLKRDVTSMDNDVDSDSPAPKRMKNLSLRDVSVLSAFSKPPSHSIHTSARTLSSPSLSKVDCDDSQMILDCGQKRFGPELCPKCGMLFSPTNGNDVSLHEQYHRQLQAPPRFRRRNGFNSVFACVQEYSDGFIYKCCLANGILHENDHHYQQAIQEICSRMNDELDGNNSGRDSERDGRQLYFFVSRPPENAVYGVLLVDHVKFAYRYDADGRIDEQPNAAAMGVNRIWTWAGVRRRRIATRLLECARCNFYFGAPIQKKHVAFSEPTISGLQFAKNYCQSNSILVYRLT